MEDCKPGDFQIALDEAFLAENGFTEKLIEDINLAAGNTMTYDFDYRGIEEATGSNQDQEFLNLVTYPSLQTILCILIVKATALSDSLSLIQGSVLRVCFLSEMSRSDETWLSHAGFVWVEERLTAL